MDRQDIEAAEEDLEVYRQLRSIQKEREENFQKYQQLTKEERIEIFPGNRRKSASVERRAEPTTRALPPPNTTSASTRRAKPDKRKSKKNNGYENKNRNGLEDDHTKRNQTWPGYLPPNEIVASASAHEVRPDKGKSKANDGTVNDGENEPEDNSTKPHQIELQNTIVKVVRVVDTMLRIWEELQTTQRNANVEKTNSKRDRKMGLAGTLLCVAFVLLVLLLLWLYC